MELKTYTELNIMEKRLLEYAILSVVLLVVKVCSLDCDGDWTAYGTACYKAYGDERKNIIQSQTLCKDENSHLVSITSQEEFQFVLDLVGPGNNFWIGLERKSKPKSTNLTDIREGWFWEDDNPLTWTDWQTNEPEYNDSTVVVIRNYNNTWFGKEPSSPMYAARVCKRALISISTNMQGPAMPKSSTQAPTDDETTNIVTSTVFEPNNTQETATVDSGAVTDQDTKKWRIPLIAAGAAVGGLVAITLIAVGCFRLGSRNRKKGTEVGAETDPQSEYTDINEEDMDSIPSHQSGRSYLDILSESSAGGYTEPAEYLTPATIYSNSVHSGT